MSVIAKRQLEIRKCKLGEEPSMVDEYAHMSPNERIQCFLEFRARLIRGRYGIDPGFERVLRVARQQ